MKTTLKWTGGALAALTGTAVLCSCGTVIQGNENSYTVVYDGVTFYSQTFYCADSDRERLGKAESGADVLSVGGFDPPRYLLVEGSDNSGCFIADGESVPTSGQVTKALIDPGVRADNSKELSKKEELDMLEELSGLTGEPRTFTIDNYFTDGNSFYYVYDDSGVSCEENWGGYVAYAQGEWIYISPDPDRTYDWGEGNSVTVTAIAIKDQDLIQRMCSTDLTKYIEY
ncbi:MAG: hypothetical protein IJ071_11355 [Ruminococcus sp.]|nr:hypothetical protein [Ruminococcus sp.]